MCTSAQNCLLTSNNINIIAATLPPGDDINVIVVIKKNFILFCDRFAKPGKGLVKKNAIL